MAERTYLSFCNNNYSEDVGEISSENPIIIITLLTTKLIRSYW